MRVFLGILRTRMGLALAASLEHSKISAGQSLASRVKQENSVMRQDRQLVLTAKQTRYRCSEAAVLYLAYAVWATVGQMEEFAVHVRPVTSRTSSVQLVVHYAMLGSFRQNLQVM